MSETELLFSLPKLFLHCSSQLGQMHKHLSSGLGKKKILAFILWCSPPSHPHEVHEQVLTFLPPKYILNWSFLFKVNQGTMSLLDYCMVS